MSAAILSVNSEWIAGAAVTFLWSTSAMVGIGGVLADIGPILAMS